MRQYLSAGMCYLIGNGMDVRIWEDPWVPSLPDFKPKPWDTYFGVERPLTVAELIDKDTGQWDRALVWSLFTPETAEAILKIHLSNGNRQDEMIWNLENSWEYRSDQCI